MNEISANLAKANKLIEKYTKETKDSQAAQSQAQTALKKLQEAGFPLKIAAFGKSTAWATLNVRFLWRNKNLTFSVAHTVQKLTWRKFSVSLKLLRSKRQKHLYKIQVKRINPFSVDFFSVLCRVCFLSIYSFLE